MTQEQDMEGYLCKCGFTTDDISTFQAHLLHEGRKDGRGVHKSMGRVNLLTNELTMPPYLERDNEQKRESSIGRRKKDAATSVTGYKSTEVLSHASSIKFVPRQMTCTYTPIMQSALVAVQKVFGWRDDMPFENFLDTIIYNYLYEHGVQLAGYIVSDDILEEDKAAEEDSAKEATKTEAEVVEMRPKSNGNGNGKISFLDILKEV